MEHHANIVPWQMICEEKKAKLKIIPMNNTIPLIIKNGIANDPISKGSTC